MAVTTAVALAAVVGTVAMARTLGFLHVRTNLSQAANLDSARPDLAISSDGNWIAVVWTEEYRPGVGDHKGDVYLRAVSEAEGGWRHRTVVFDGNDTESAYDAAMAISDTTAHVAYVVVNDTPGQEKMQIRYRDCSLVSGECNPEQQVVSVSSWYKITWVDIAVGEYGLPHVVWSQTDQYGDDGVIRYTNLFYDNEQQLWQWSPAERVSLGYDCYRPAIAYANGHAHVVWEKEQDDPGQELYHIGYARRDESGWEITQLSADQTTFPPGNPDVAAWGDRVFVTWDWCSDFDPEPCDLFNVVYRRSDDGGTTWRNETNDTREVGTGRRYYGDELAKYYSSDDKGINPDDKRDECLLGLQPSITMNRDGWPAVAWHADRSEGDGTDYVIYYTYALTDGQDHVDWITPTLLGGWGTLRSSATFGVAQTGPGEQHVHLVYMEKFGSGAWEVFYNSNEEDQYEHIFLPMVMRGG